MITSKFGIGQQVRHKLLGSLGVVIDIDPEYAWMTPRMTMISAPTRLCVTPLVSRGDGG